MQDVIYPKPEKVFIIRRPHSPTGSGISIRQRALNRPMHIGNRRVVKIPANQRIIRINLFYLFRHGFRLTGTNAECRPQLLGNGIFKAAKRLRIQVVSLNDSRWLLISVNFFPAIFSSWMEEPLKELSYLIFRDFVMGYLEKTAMLNFNAPEVPMGTIE